MQNKENAGKITKNACVFLCFFFKILHFAQKFAIFVHFLCNLHNYARCTNFFNISLKFCAIRRAASLRSRLEIFIIPHAALFVNRQFTQTFNLRNPESLCKLPIDKFSGARRRVSRVRAPPKRQNCQNY